MKPLYKGLLLAGLQVALVASLAAKLHMDRAQLPRVWVKSAPYDPNLPIRGRYVRLALQVDVQTTLPLDSRFRALLKVEGDKLVAVPIESPWKGQVVLARSVRNGRVWVLAQPVAYFIPEHVPDPSQRLPDEELWVEVTLLPKGPPRPIRLGVKKEGVLTPLDFR